MHLRRVAGAVQAVEALDEQIVVDRPAPHLAVDGDAADPMAERPLRRTVPRLLRVILADEADAVVEEHAVVSFAGPQFAAGRAAPAGRGLDLIVRHGRTVSGVRSQDSARESFDS